MPLRKKSVSLRCIPLTTEERTVKRIADLEKQVHDLEEKRDEIKRAVQRAATETKSRVTTSWNADEPVVQLRYLREDMEFCNTLAQGLSEESGAKVNTQPLILRGHLGNKRVSEAKKRGMPARNYQARILMDSGAGRDIVSLNYCRKFGLTTRKGDTPIRVELADGHTKEISTVADIDVHFGQGYVYTVTAYVMELGSRVDCILGTPWLATLGEYRTSVVDKYVKFKHNGQWIKLTANEPVHYMTDRVEVVGSVAARRDIRKLRKQGISPIMAVLQPTHPGQGSPEEDAQIVPRMGAPSTTYTYDYPMTTELKQHRARLVMKIDVRTPDFVRVKLKGCSPEELKSLTADERDSLYPFGENKPTVDRTHSTTA